MEGFAVYQHKNSSCASCKWVTSIPKHCDPLTGPGPAAQLSRNITRRPHQTPATGLQTQATDRDVTELVGRWMWA